MADALKSAGKNVEQKPSNELDGIQSHGPLLARLSIAIKKGHMTIADGSDTAIGDCHAMGVAAQILEDRKPHCWQ